MSANAFLIDSEIRHQVFIQRLSGGIWNEVDPVLRQLRQSIIARLSDEPTDFQLNRLTLLLRDIEGIVQEGGNEFGTQVEMRLSDFLEYEADFQGRKLGGVLNVDFTLPSPEQLAAAFTSQPAEIVTGQSVTRLTVSDMVRQFTEKKQKEIVNLVRMGAIEGQTTDEITRQVSGRVEGRTRAQARALVRTATNHTATVARKETMKANTDVLEGEEWVATLDARTSLICFGLSGRIFPVDSGPYPPQHFNCRSVRVPKVKEEFSLFREGSTRPAVGADGVEQVSTRKTFGGWLKSQPASFQREFFGKFTDGEEKRQLFLNGGLDPQRFIDPNGVALSLDELRRLEPLAFDRAGL